jgi:demethylmenaquinone methyltransferase/2-methoxy-6-polyprenyl-1,4-benzoquinol methylase
MLRVLTPGGQVGILEFSRPDGLLGPLARFYLNAVMPRLGRWISGRHGPYDYLADSIRTWPLPDELAGLLSEAGFRDVTWHRFPAGIATLHTGRREGRPRSGHDASPGLARHGRGEGLG